MLTFILVEMHDGNAFVPIFADLLLKVQLAVDSHIAGNVVVELLCRSALRTE